VEMKDEVTRVNLIYIPDIKKNQSKKMLKPSTL